MLCRHSVRRVGGLPHHPRPPYDEDTQRKLDPYYQEKERQATRDDTKNLADTIADKMAKPMDRAADAMAHPVATASDAMHKARDKADDMAGRAIGDGHVCS